LQLAARAESELTSGGSGQRRRYSEYATGRRWQFRLHMVASARANLMTEQLRAERDHHAKAALVDELTGLVNQRGYRRYVDRLRRATDPHRLAVLLVDIDRFKRVNDTHGHAVGDEVLARVGETLTSGTRVGDLVARLGGDEFVVLLDGFSVEAAQRRGVDLLTLLDKTDWESVSPDLLVRVSIGVAAETSGNDPELLVRRADTALYAAKASGGGRVEVALTDAP